MTTTSTDLGDTVERRPPSDAAAPPERSRSFGTVAEDYDRFRPEPPMDAVAWVVPAEARRVVDIGAGTGALTRRLLQCTPALDEVMAVEPDDRMRAVLCRRAPAAHVLAGTAEAIPLPDGSVDAVVGSSMWHWVDPARAVPEVARVLAPGGVLGLLWSGPDRSVPWVAELLGRHSGRRAGMSGPDAARRELVTLPGGSPFGPPERRRVTWRWEVTAEEIVGLAGTYSGSLVLEPAARQRFLADVRALVEEHPQLSGGGTVTLPMACRCWRAALQRE